MIRVSLALSILLGAMEASGEDLASPPIFFALSVPSLEASIKWYGENLGLSATRLPGSPEAKVALLRGQGLVVELVEHSKAFDLNARIPGIRGRYLVHGLFKAGFFVQDLDATIQRLQKRGVRFKGDAFTDEILRARSILMLDNSENVIQLFETLR